MANIILTEEQKHQFLARLEMDGDCLVWPNTTDYGRININGQTLLVHRVAWALVHGPVPPGRLVCHACDNPPCANPHHLFLGSHKDNTVDASRKRRLHRQHITHCPKGHPYAGDNLLIERHGTQRTCRTCRLARGRRAYAIKKGLSRANH